VQRHIDSRIEKYQNCDLEWEKLKE
jgi:hypothetical protein